jgi:hypothetical protein
VIFPGSGVPDPIQSRGALAVVYHHSLGHFWLKLLSLLGRYVNKSETSKYFEVGDIGFFPVPELIWGDIICAGDGAVLHVNGALNGEAQS